MAGIDEIVRLVVLMHVKRPGCGSFAFEGGLRQVGLWWNAHVFFLLWVCDCCAAELNFWLWVSGRR